MNPPAGDAVKDALERLLASPQFAGSPRASRFLRFVVEAALDGRGDGLKEYVLGVEVYDRPASSDPRIDTIVRVEAVKIRRRLRAYYRGAGRRDPVIIDLPKGGYVPQFRLRLRRSPELNALHDIRQSERIYSAVDTVHKSDRVALQFQHEHSEDFEAPRCHRVPGIASAGLRGGPFAGELTIESLAQVGNHLIAQQTIPAISRAAELFRECMLRRPEHALSYLGLADCLFLQSALGLLPPAQARRRCIALSANARAIEPHSSDVQLGYARLANCYEWNWEGAEMAYRRAIELGPYSAPAHGWYGGYLVRKGEVDRGVREIQLAATLDPVSVLPRSLLADAFYLGEDFQRCLAVCDEALVLYPNDWLLHSIMSKALLATGDRASSLMHCKKAARVCGDLENVVIVGDLAHILATSNRADAARRLLSRLERRRLSKHVSAVILARICTALGRNEEALGWLERGCDDRDIFMSSIKSDVRLAPLRRYARFQAILQEMRL